MYTKQITFADFKHSAPEFVHICSYFQAKLRHQ